VLAKVYWTVTILFMRARSHLFTSTLFSLSILGVLNACGPTGTTVEGTPTTPSVTGSCSGGTTSAQVRIFQENPRVDSTNLNLAFNTTTSSLSSYTVDRTLSGLDGTCLLQTDHYKVTRDSFYPNTIAAATSTNLIYTPADPQFQQIMALYHSNAVKEKVQSTGNALSGLGMVSIDAHCGQYQNAYFNPSSNSLCFGYENYGGRRVWAADDADVIHHETGHTINHALAGSDVLNYGGEAGAMDEAFADYWALTMQANNTRISEWFLGAIEAVTGQSIMRDAGQNHSYPSSLVYELHDDSRVWGEALWQIRTQLGAPTTDKLVANSIKLIASPGHFTDGINAMNTAANLLNLSAGDKTTITNIFTAKGLQRTDSAAGLALSTVAGHKSVYIIDDHSLSINENGNCNGVLDEGETILIMVNLENTSGSALGVVSSSVVSNDSSKVAVIPGGNVGEYFRFAPNSDFVSVLNSANTMSEDATLTAGFIIRAETGSAGVRTLTMNLQPIGGAPVSIPFTVNIGTAAHQSSCTNSALWP
jgi:hypothetical protein